MGIIKKARDHYFLLDSSLSSHDYGMSVSCDNGFALPERDVKYVSVPGRNGDLIIDNGKWKNIDVTYNDCLIENDFQTKFSAFKNKIGQMRGYVRLEDTFDPDHYRLADMSAAKVKTVGTRYHSGVFDVTFNCKPQRFLKSGEKAMQILPAYPVGSQVYSAYIPIGGDSLTFKVNCQSTDTLAVIVYTYDSNKSQLSSDSGSYVDGDTHTVTFSGSDIYWRIQVAGYADLDKISIDIKTTSLLDGEPFEIDCPLGRTFTLTNPTGFATKPLIEVYNSTCRMSIENYTDGVREEYYDFNVASTGGSHFYIDCETQYLYDDNGDNLTNKLSITTAESAIGKALVFPELGENQIVIEAYYTSLDSGCTGIVSITPRWWTL